MIMKNVRQKLADACKNVEMSRELNEFTSYMATVVNDELNPEGMLLMYACVLVLQLIIMENFLNT